MTKDPLQAQAAALLDKLQKERGKDKNAPLSLPAFLARSVKERPTTKTLLSAPPELQAAFVRHVVLVYAKLGARGKKAYGSHEWFRKDNLPTAGEEVAKLIMRRRMPFTDDMIAEMLEQIAAMDFITFAPLTNQLVPELEKRADEAPLPARIRTAAKLVADGLLVKDWPAEVAEDNGFPQAADRKLAGRIQNVLTGPLTL
jgi:hypothetical protein